MRVVGIVAPFAPIKGRYPEIIRFIELRGGGEGPTRLLSGASSSGSHGRARQTSKAGPCEDCRRVEWVLGPRGQY